jgi:protoporphyrinogen oxidase
MVPDAETTSLGLEYFCFEHDSLWEMSDEQLIELAGKELAGLGLVERSNILDGVVRRVPKAYPVYDTQYKEGLAAVQEFLKGIENLQLIGRNGMHHYNNQDHSMVTGILAARNILGAKYNLWRVNSDPKYLEEGDEGLDALVDLAETQPMVPLTMEAREIA